MSQTGAVRAVQLFLPPRPPRRHREKREERLGFALHGSCVGSCRTAFFTTEYTEKAPRKERGEMRLRVAWELCGCVS